MSDEKNPPENQWLAIGLSLGLAFGAVFGLLLDNIALGIAVGPAIGLAIGIGADQARKRGPEDPARGDRED